MSCLKLFTPWAILGSITLFFILGPYFAHGFSQKDFNLCEQSGFCRRQRSLFRNGTTPIGWSLSNWKLENGVWNGVIERPGIQGADACSKLFISIHALKGTDTWQWHVHEQEQEDDRYAIPDHDVLLRKHLIVDTSVTVKEVDDAIELRRSSSVLVIKKVPSFMISVINSNGLEVMVWNRFNGLHVEPLSGISSRTDKTASVGVDVVFVGTEHVYGIPEHATSLNLPSTVEKEPYRLYNLDVFEYELNSNAALYGSIPFMTGHNVDSSCGFLFLNPSEMWIDVDRFHENGNVHTKTHWFAESGRLFGFFFTGPTIDLVQTQYARLTGPPALPPLFSLSYHQCRWNYKDEADAIQVQKKFDENDIPFDVLWLDIEHTDGKRYFTWHKENFPTPQKMIGQFERNKRKMVTIVDPHIKKDDNYYICKNALAANVFVKDSDKNDFVGHCWPGDSYWIDYVNPKGRKFWTEQFSLTNYVGSTNSLFIWNDMNEPSVFGKPEITMPKDNLHVDGKVEHRDIHNMFGMYQHAATAQGLANRDQRPFVLSRAFFSGSQKYGAIWTGDNLAEWSHMVASVPMLLSISMAGLSFSGADVGGFFKDPDPELLVRWYQLGAFQPFFRAHAHIDSKRREPWLFGETVMNQIRLTIKERYKILVYIYTLFYESSRNGVAVMRPLFQEFPKDSSLFSYQMAFMLGPSLLVHLIERMESTEVNVNLPGNQPWFDYFTGEKFLPGLSVTLPVQPDHLPIFVRSGRIIPQREIIRRSSTLMRYDPITLLVVLNDNGFAQGSLYLDDEESFHHLGGKSCYSQVEFSKSTLTGKIGSCSPSALGEYSNPEVYKLSYPYSTPRSKSEDKYSSVVINKIVIWNVKANVGSVILNGNKLKFTANGMSITVKKPLVKVCSNWTIKFE